MNRSQAIIIISLFVVGIIILVKFALPQVAFNSATWDIKCSGDGLSKITCPIPAISTSNADISEGTTITWSVDNAAASVNILYTIINVVSTEKGSLPIFDASKACPLKGFSNGCSTPCYFYATDGGAALSYSNNILPGIGYGNDLKCGSSYNINYDTAISGFKNELMVMTFGFYNTETLVATGSAYGYCNLPAQNCVVKELNIPKELPAYTKARVTSFDIYPSTQDATNETICSLTQMRCSVPEVIPPAEEPKVVINDSTEPESLPASLPEVITNIITPSNSLVVTIFWVLAGMALIFIGYMFYKRFR